MNNIRFSFDSPITNQQFKKLLFFILIILIIGLLATGAIVYYYRQSKNAKEDLIKKEAKTPIKQYSQEEILQELSEPETGPAAKTEQEKILKSLPPVESQDSSLQQKILEELPSPSQ